MATEKSFDCVVCGSCVADILVRPVPLGSAIGGGELVQVEPIELTTGGVVCNAGVAMTRLGMRVAAFSRVGDDPWGAMVRDRLRAEGVDTRALTVDPQHPTSTTAVLIDERGERSFAHCVGAPKEMDRSTYLDHLQLFEKSRFALIGYYSLLPRLEDDLAEVLAAIRRTGCKTALDAAGDGGGLRPLDQLLPVL